LAILSRTSASHLADRHRSPSRFRSTRGGWPNIVCPRPLEHECDLIGHRGHPKLLRHPPQTSRISRRFEHDCHFTTSIRHMSRDSRRESGKFGPRMQTSVSRSSCLRYRRTDFLPSRWPSAQRMCTFHSRLRAIPGVPTSTRTKLKEGSLRSRSVSSTPSDDRSAGFRSSAAFCTCNRAVTTARPLAPEPLSDPVNAPRGCTGVHSRSRLYTGNCAENGVPERT
jgi:hypothetical protein